MSPFSLLMLTLLSSMALALSTSPETCVPPRRFPSSSLSDRAFALHTSSRAIVIPSRVFSSSSSFFGLSLIKGDMLIQGAVRSCVTKEYKAWAPLLIDSLPFIRYPLNEILLGILERGKTMKPPLDNFLTKAQRETLSSWLRVTPKSRMDRALHRLQEDMSAEMELFTHLIIESKVNVMLGIFDAMASGDTRKGTLPPVPIVWTKKQALDYYVRNILPVVMENFDWYRQHRLHQVTEGFIQNFVYDIMPNYLKNSTVACDVAERAAHATALILRTPIDWAWKGITRQVWAGSEARMRLWLGMKPKSKPGRVVQWPAGMKEKPVELQIFEGNPF
ncbi:hypothetical protein BJ684DRAFT_15950 [Piptocephalis cylindrospora]|uniref:Cytochrome P450 n=1 Tax=Piptocephalis cylindrospora TaxID=1907219 RepID=A0A4P9Y3Z3_9FUNG|nr:hypothetical protein BJ684DRAFT_15950 [Piptocephalis cylindrospora]|eukprot:RKP13676.1 hypothetical protein BJ684DRAFT_15950 [Piptocephalis cylindrospora]